MAEISTDRPRRLADFLRENRNHILDRWAKAVEGNGTARTLSRPVLLDHMPQFLDELADFIDGRRAGHLAHIPRDNPQIHAVERLGEGYDLREVVDEYATLRACICDLAVHSRASSLRSIELPLLHQAIDQAISVAVQRYAEARERTLRALYLISSTARAEHDVESLLPKLLDSFLATTATAGSVALSLLDDGKLEVRATAGYAQPEQFAAEVVAHGEKLDRKADQVLYGIPLRLGDRTLGAVVMGSREGHAFSSEDQQLFRTMANRAAELIAHADLDAQRERIMSVLGHDLRNPLGVILISAQSIQRRHGLDDFADRSLTRIAQNARRIERMIRDLLDYTRARLGRQMALSLRLVDLAALCRQAVDDLRVLHPARTVSVDCGDGAVRVEADPDRISQVLGNLVSNALRHGAADGAVTVRLRGAEGGVLLEVHNPGPAIAPELLPRIFDAFQRGVSGGEGLGLGLHIVKRIVEAHGGTVAVRSSDAEGTTFTVRLPAPGAAHG